MQYRVGHSHWRLRRLKSRKLPGGGKYTLDGLGRDLFLTDGRCFDRLLQLILRHVLRRNRSQDGVLGTSQLSGVGPHDPDLAEQVTQAVNRGQALLFVRC